jgi:hypothetical protein
MEMNMKKLFTALAVVAIFLTAIFCVSATDIDINNSPAATGEVLGDANGDGSVNAKDVLAIKRDVVNVEKASVGADADSNGRVNAKDVLAIKRDLVGIEKIADLPTANVGIFAVEGVNVRDMTIVAPAGTDPEEDNSAYAAEELQKYIYQATSVKVPVVYTGVSPTEHAFYIVTDPTWEGWDSDDWDGGDLRKEDFVIEVKDGDVYITGGYLRGCMYGVYEFAESYLGWRFMNDNEYLYNADIINLKNGIYDKQTATLSYRYTGSGGGDKRKMNGHHDQNQNDKKYGYTAANNLINAHSFAYYRYLVQRDGMDESLDWVVENYDKYEGFTFGSDPLINTWNSSWQPCFSSDYDEMFYGLIKMSAIVWYGWNRVIIPGESRMSFSIMDNENYCQCAECRETYARIGVSGASVEFASRAADEYQEYFPGVKLYMILYEHSPYVDGVYVSENLSIMYCGTGCNNHIPGSGECGDNVTSIGGSNTQDEESFPSWCDVCDNVYFWEYGVNYHFYLAPSPNVFNIYGDLEFVINSGGAGLYYENTDHRYTFEGLKSYIAACVMWDTDMTEDEVTDVILEYLYFNYGDGYEDIYRIIELINEASDAAGCWTNNHDRPWDMHDPDTIASYADELFALVEAAREKAGSASQLKSVNDMAMHVYFLTLCATYEDVYVNGDAEAKAQYTERYEWLYNYIKSNDYDIFSSDVYTLPSTCNLDSNPMTQFYGTGYSNR